MLRGATSLALAVLVASCTGSAGDDANRTVTIADERVAVARLVEAHVALCQAARRPDSARTLFFDRSHEALHTVARGVEDVDRAQAAELLQAKERVESELAAAPPSLPDDLVRLAEIYRSSLGRLAIEAPPCDK